MSGKPCPRLIEPVATARADISAKTVVPSPSRRCAGVRLVTSVTLCGRPLPTARPRGACRVCQTELVTKAYWINTFRSVSDPQKLAAYIELAGPAMRTAGGRFLARGRPARAFEAGVLERTVVIEFDSVEQAVAAYESRSYQDALRALGDGAERDLRIIEAVS